MADDSVFRETQFQTLPQQREASQLGLWVFLATEVLFFGGCFLCYSIYRGIYPEAFAMAARHTDVVLGSVNTLVLLTSSLAVALAVRTVADANLRLCRIFLGVALLLGIIFLAIKAFEYHADITEHLVPGESSALPPGPARVFFTLYWIMTAVHALHVSVGIGILAVMFRALFRQPERMRATSRLEVAGLYWHFVDVIWIFLYPLLYLVGRTR